MYIVSYCFLYRLRSLRKRLPKNTRQTTPIPSLSRTFLFKIRWSDCRNVIGNVRLRINYDYKFIMNIMSKRQIFNINKQPLDYSYAITTLLNIIECKKTQIRYRVTTFVPKMYKIVLHKYVVVAYR